MSIRGSEPKVFAKDTLPADPRLKACVVRRVDRARLLRTEWEDLLRRAQPCSAALTFDYAMEAFEAFSNGLSLAIIEVRFGDRLVCLWPLAVARLGLTSVATHLGCGSREEYAGPILEAGDQAEDAFKAALSLAKKLADVLRIYNLRLDQTAARVITAGHDFKLTSQIYSPVTTLVGVSDWQSWVSAKSKSFRSGLKYDRRRLEMQGRLEFREMSGPIDGPKCIEWIFLVKKAWLDQHAIRISWLRDPRAMIFFSSLATKPREKIPMMSTVAYALFLDSHIIAACICLLSTDRMEYYVTAFDPAWHSYSPGNLLLQDCATEAISRQLNLDFRITQDQYKSRWADRDDAFGSFLLACTATGWVAVAFWSIDATIRKVGVRWRPRIKGWFRRFVFKGSTPASPPRRSAD